MGRDHDEVGRWFQKPAVASSPLPRRKARVLAAAIWGGAVGGLAGVPSLILATFIARRIGQAMHPLASSSRGFALAAGVGAAIGLVLGLAMTHSLRLRARLIFAPVASLALYLLAHELFLRSREVPLAPMLAGVAVYGLCLGFAPPFDRQPR